jgi:rhodanese-related sulfurtransferase
MEERVPTPLTAHEVKTKLEHDPASIAILDMRQEDRWHSSSIRIPDAIRIPPQNFTGEDPRIPSSGEVVTYCEEENEDLSRQLASKIMSVDRPNVHYLAGGLQAWELAGYPLEEK